MKKTGSGSEYNWCLLNQEQACNTLRTPWNTLEHPPDGLEPPRITLNYKNDAKKLQNKNSKISLMNQ